MFLTKHYSPVQLRFELYFYDYFYRLKITNLESVVTDFELVCENSYIDPIISSLFMAGMLFGVTIFGLVAQNL